SRRSLASCCGTTSAAASPTIWPASSSWPSSSSCPRASGATRWPRRSGRPRRSCDDATGSHPCAKIAAGPRDGAPPRGTAAIVSGLSEATKRALRAALALLALAAARPALPQAPTPEPPPGEADPGPLVDALLSGLLGFQEVGEAELQKEVEE